MVGIGQFPRVAGFVAALFAFAATAFAPAWAAESLIGVRFGITSGSETRVVFDLSGPVVYALSGDPSGEGQVIVEFQGMAPVSGSGGKGAGHVASYRLDGAEAVLSLARTARVKQHFVLPAKAAGEKTRLVIDLVTSDKAAFEASLPKKYKDMAAVIEAATAPTKAAAAPVPLPQIATPQTPPRLPVIVIDPGHGGGDPGAVGPAGTKEKTVTLAAAVELADVLRAKGRYRVVLLRSDDSRVPLEDRLKAAREAAPDLFISIHADAHHDPKVRGGSVYTLSDEGSKRSTREVLSQGDYQIFDLNIKDEPADLRPILVDLAQSHTKNRSGQFADLLIKHLSGVTPLINNTHRTADLKVLLSPDIAAVLLELAFISNAQDEANLISPAWRKKTMGAVAHAIDAYFDALTPVQHASRGREGTR